MRTGLADVLAQAGHDAPRAVVDRATSVEDLGDATTPRWRCGSAARAVATVR